MNSRTAVILVVGVLLGGLLVACSSKRDPGILSDAQAQGGESGGSVPPGIKKGVKVEFVPVTTPNMIETGVTDTFYETPIVEDVKGSWVLMRFKPKKEGVGGFKEVVYWVNFNQVVIYRIK